MNNHKVRDLLQRVLPPVLLLAAGILFLVFGFVTVNEMRSYPQTTATVTKIEREWVPDAEGGDTEEITIYVRYRVAGQNYEEVLNNCKTSYQEGETISVYYKPDDPHYVSGATKGGAAIRFAFGGVLTFAGLAALPMITFRKKREIAHD